ncbi:MAG: DUF5110 domain-containing protein [Bacteroidales bacterium]|nr:DUF5110 domain-containing protein [Bacteroidales bacterium]
MKLSRLFLFAALLCGCTTGKVIECGNGEKVRLTAINENIIHVESVPAGASFSDRASLVTVPHKAFRDFEYYEKDGAKVLKTSRLMAVVNIADGRVMYSRVGEPLLVAEDTRSFTPIEVEGDKGWTVRQTFVPFDESFYGLGQHQADEWDWKGRNEELYQYNTKISLPFVISSRGYGILWDSYSLCRWGDPRPYAQLSEVFKLYDKDGVEGALTGTYTPRRGETLVRRETALDQEFLRVPECDRVMGAPAFNFNGSHVEYDGWLEPSEGGIFRFYLYYAGYMKVFIDGKEVMPEIWRTAWNPNGRKFSVKMIRDTKVPIHIEWKPDGGTSYCALKVLSPVPEEEQEKMSWWGEMQDGIDYYFINGEDSDEVISGYRTLTGKAPVPPKWAMGFWQSYERYRNQFEVVDAVRGFRSRNIPMDNIVQDWQYWKPDQWGSHEFDESRYPDPTAMVDSVHAMDARFMISVWPKFYTNTEHFREFDSKGWMYQVPVKDSVEDWLGYQQSFYDAYSEGARKLFWKQMKDHLYPIGVDAWWMDASEPNIHDCTDMDYRKAMSGPTALGSSTRYFNAYALMNAQAIYDGQRATKDGKRVFLLTRNGFSGMQRYSTASWSGDIGTRWEDMKAQISAGLNYSVAGIPLWGQDVGGFSVENRYSAAQNLFNRTGEVSPDLEEWRELQLRWHQWGRFTPIYRAHGQFPMREPWSIAPEGEPAYEGIVACIRDRYSMMPYIYSLAARVHFDDYTIMRPLVMDFASDSDALGISDEFMFGDALLVCPVYEYGARSREVYLPQGCGWYRIQGDKVTRYEGGLNLLADAPLEDIPTYYREGQIFVRGNDVPSTATEQTELSISVFTGKDADFRLYSDDGTDYSYEKGAFAWIPMHWDEASRTLTLDDMEGSWAGMPEGWKISAQAVDRDGITRAGTFTYMGLKVSLKF